MFDLSHYSIEEQANIYNNMNCWEWDNRAGNSPENFDNLPDWIDDSEQESKHKYISPIMHNIEDRIGRKAILKEWNVHNLHNGRMSEIEFEDWYINGTIPKRLYKEDDE